MALPGVLVMVTYGAEGWYLWLWPWPRYLLEALMDATSKAKAKDFIFVKH